MYKTKYKTDICVTDKAVYDIGLKNWLTFENRRIPIEYINKISVSIKSK
jgi:hypothetical protein